ncbi:Fe-S protein assembly co-chaperone HscB [Roseateles saccharophilus]|uniref:Co-chaperone protein HscB homolog n=1 Tax=Roseateles saccharophilus TaxID=304 RepID=A0A4R3VI54_ROSSA|nr:Fe-S protein assembly co-chaperone HscB [Roseateles saccharophilus]MDG0832056.1 Fe-S protein assembly co-chaperone HscB [Roseateles saccharophilus]TCV03464.1 co-chaperone protein HscB [Roseateles saccharophilus]
MTSEPTASLADDDFSLFGLPRRQALDRTEVDARWRALQAQVHPDRFASQGGATQQLALQWAMRVNEAYQRLKEPVGRAAYLCGLNGIDVSAGRNLLPRSFLMQQMEWREALEAAGARDAVQALADVVRTNRETLLRELAEHIDGRQDWPAAAGSVQALMFIARFATDLDARLDG